MDVIVYVIKNVVISLLGAIELAMLVRAILSWLPLNTDNKFAIFINSVTEPLIYPVRLALNKLGWFQNSPIDFSFFFTYLLLVIVTSLLEIGI